MEKTVEFKIRVPEVDRWEDTPVYLSKSLSGSTEEIAEEAKEIAEGIAFSQHSEVRWNYEGDTQGHYVDEGFPEKSSQGFFVLMHKEINHDHEYPRSCKRRRI
jgi:hypothetical protein